MNPVTHDIARRAEGRYDRVLIALNGADLAAIGDLFGHPARIASELARDEFEMATLGLAELRHGWNMAVLIGIARAAMIRGGNSEAAAHAEAVRLVNDPQELKALVQRVLTEALAEPEETAPARLNVSNFLRAG